MLLWFVSGLCISTQAAPVFPVKCSANNRYLTDQNDAPFPILGRTAWFITSLTETDYRTFVDDSVARGCNSIELHAINRDMRGNNPPFNSTGAAPFLSRIDGVPWNGSFSYGDINTDAPDFTTPNEAYWSAVDGLLAYCESKGVLVFMFPAYAGFQGGEQGWMQEMVANGSTRMQFYGTWIATRYKSQKNIVWMMGGDFGTPPHNFNDAQTSVENGLFMRLQSVAGQQSSFFSAEWASESISTDQTNFGAAMTLNGVYSYLGNVSYHGRRAFTNSPTRPAFLLEEPYDQEGPDGNSVNPNAIQPVRRFQWWGWLSTIGGYVSGNGYVWPFRTNNATVDWRNHLNTQGSRDMARLNSFIKSISWQELVPSGLSGMRNLITAGGSAESLDDYVSAAANTNGTILVAYIPPAHSGSITVDMAAMDGPVIARWFDPTSAAYIAIATGLTNVGTHTFTPPENNSVGQADWVLVLQCPKPDNTPPSVPSGLTAMAAGLNQINLSWMAASDNVAVAGYRLERCSGVDCNSFIQVAEVSNNIYADAGLTSGTSARYRVLTVDTSTNISAYSSVVSVKTWTAQPPWSGLVADYAFEEGGGTIAADASGNGNTAWVGSAEWSPSGKFGGSIFFNGANFLTASNSPSLNITNSLTMGAWVYPTATATNWTAIILKEASGGLSYSLQSDPANRPSIQVQITPGDIQGISGPTALPLNTWTHVAGTYDGASLLLFVNGTLLASNSAYGSIVSSTAPLRVGGDSISGGHFIGKLDALRIYNRVLQPEEIQTDMNRVSGAPPVIQLHALPQTTQNLAEAGFKLSLSADTSAIYIIEVTTNFLAWEMIRAIQYTNGLYEIVDGQPAFPTRSFYRVKPVGSSPTVSLSVLPQPPDQIVTSGFQFSVSADAPAVLAVERTADFIFWQQVGAFAYTNGPDIFTDASLNLPFRFYRARLY